MKFIFSKFEVILILLLQFANIILWTKAEDTNVKTSPILKIAQGELQGRISTSRDGNDYYAFWGIPYAKPPKRFQPPELPSIPGWTGVRNATTPSEICSQVLPFVNKLAGSEDCLYLNVFTSMAEFDNGLPNDELKPVLVYIYGGAFMLGSADIYGERFLMDEPVVFVTFNYRVSSLGFLNVEQDGNQEQSVATNIARGNMGLKDQTMALKWIQENINVFGGDPSKVTIFGTSAGGASVSYHMISPLSQGLFHNAISASGSALNPWALQRNPKYFAKELATKLDCPTDDFKTMVDCLLEQDAKDIIVKSSITLEWPLDPIAPFGPSIESSLNNPQAFLLEDPEVLLKEGKSSKVPWMAGVTKNEGLILHAGHILKNPVLTKELNENWKKIAPVAFGFQNIIPENKWEAATSDLRSFYFGTRNISYETEQELEDLYSDRNFIHGIRTNILYQAKHSPVFPYIFDFKNVGSGLMTFLGNKYDDKITHGADTVFVFNGNIFGYFLPSNFTEGREFSKKFVKLLVSFVKNGYPDGHLLGTTEWPYTSLEQANQSTPLKWFHLNSKTSLEDETFTERMIFWDNLFKKYR